MADAQKTIDLIFNGIDKTGAATLAALNNTKKFTGSVQDITQPISDFTLGAAKFEAGLLTAGLAATVFSVKVAGDFDTAFRQISTLFDANAQDLGTFRDSILSYAKTSTKPLVEITDSLAAAIGSGVDYTKSLDLISAAEKLAVATRADLRGTTEVLVSTLNAYGLKTEDAGKVSDLFFQVIKDGKIEMNDLAASLAAVTPIAAASGVSLEEVGAAIATLTASGIQPSQAIEYLRSAISNIIKPSKQAAELAAELGIEFDSNALKSKGLAGVLNDVAKATGGSTDKMSRLIGDVGGLTAALVLTGPQADKFKEAVVSMGNAAGSVQEAFQKMAGSLDNSVAKAGNAFKVLLVTFGTPLLDEFGGIATAIANILGAIGTSAQKGNLKDLVDYVEGIFGQVQQTLETVAKNLPAALEGADFSGFKRGIDLVLGSISSLFNNIDLTTVEGLKTLIEASGAAFLGLSTYVKGVIDAFKPLFDTLISVGMGTSSANLSFLEFAGNMSGIATQINVLLPVLTTLLGVLTVKQGFGLVAGLAEVGPAIAAASAAAAGGIGLLGTAGLAGAFGLAGYQAGSVLAPAIDNVISKATGSKTSLGGFIYDLINGAEEAKKLGLGATDAAGGIAKIGDAAKGAGALNGVAKDIQGVKDGTEGLSQATDTSAEGILRMVNAAEKAGTSQAALSGSIKDTSKYALETVPIFDALTGKISGYEQQLVKSSKGTIELGKNAASTGTSISKTAAETAKAEEAQKKWNEQVAKMNFEEKLKLIDQQTKITTANIEADAKRTVAAFESISVSVESTGKLIGDLTGQFKDFDKIGSTDQSIIRDQIELENKRRQQALDLQTKLTEAQVAQMKAQTNALIKGDGLIKIDGAGLKPHLEAFMFEILRTIQVKVNKDGLKLLLGV